MWSQWISRQKSRWDLGSHWISQQKSGPDIWSQWISRQNDRVGSMISENPGSRSMGSDPRSIFSDTRPCLPVSFTQLKWCNTQHARKAGCQKCTTKYHTSPSNYDFQISNHFLKESVMTTHGTVFPVPRKQTSWYCISNWLVNWWIGTYLTLPFFADQSCLHIIVRE